MKNLFIHQKMNMIMTLMFSIMLSLSSNNFMTLWISMEINLMTFIPMLLINSEIYSEKATMIYFLMQTLSSVMILFSIIFLSFNSMENLSKIMMSMMIIAIVMKMGMFPFHFWIISMIENISWFNCFLILTIQKIIPIVLIFHIIQKKMILTICILNMLIASISGLTMFSMRKIFSFSSMNHLALIMLSIIISKKIFKMYFLIYLFMNAIAMNFMHMQKIFYIQNIMINLKNSSMDFINLMVIFFSLMGIPPFLGFMPKMMVIMKMSENVSMILTLFMLIFSTLASFFYLRITIMNMMLSLTKKKMNKKLNKKGFSWIILIMFPIAII